MKPIKTFSIKNPISKIKYADDKLIIIDKENTIRFIDIKTFKSLGGFKIKLPENRMFNTVDVSNDGKYLAIAVTKTREAVIYDLESKKLLYTLQWHKGEIDAISFDQNSHYVSTGGTDGKVFMWNLLNGKMVGSMPPHADYVSSTQFSKNNFWFASGSYDKTIKVTNISSMRFVSHLRAHSSAITSIKFLENFKLLSGDKGGGIILWDYTKNKLLSRFDKLMDKVIELIPVKNESYLFAASFTKNISLYDLNTYQTLTKEFIKTPSKITTMEYIEELNYLIIGDELGHILIFDLLYDENLLEKYIFQKDYQKAYELVDKNPLLKKSLAFTKLNTIWENTLNNIQKLLEEGKNQEAQKIAKPFLEIANKRAILQSLFRDFKEFAKFKKLVKMKKYPLAYSLAKQYPSFKETIYYQHMENEWRKTFNKVKDLILKPGNDATIREILTPFRGIAEKSILIQGLFKEKNIFEVFKRKFANKDFRGLFELVNKNPFLTETDEYKKVLEFGEKLKHAIEKEFNAGNYPKVMQYSNILEDFPMEKAFAKDMKEKASIEAEFMRNIANKDFNIVYAMVEKYPYLQNTENFKELETKWFEIVFKAEDMIAKGDVKGIFELMKDYIKISDKYPKITELVKSAYLNQIQSAIKSKIDNEKLQEGINKYTEIFGVDTDLEDLLFLAKRKGYNIKIINEGNGKNWHKKDLPNSLF